MSSLGRELWRMVVANLFGLAAGAILGRAWGGFVAVFLAAFVVAVWAPDIWCAARRTVTRRRQRREVEREIEQVIRESTWGVYRPHE